MVKAILYKQVYALLTQMLPSELKAILPEMVKAAMPSAIPGALAMLSLDPDKHYVLVFPEDINPEDLQAAVAGWGGSKRNVMILQANNIKLIEFGGHSDRQ